MSRHLTLRFARDRGFALMRDGRKVGCIQPLAPDLWIAALDDPPRVVRARSLHELRDKLRRTT